MPENIYSNVWNNLNFVYIIKEKMKQPESMPAAGAGPREVDIDAIIDKLLEVRGYVCLTNPR